MAYFLALPNGDEYTIASGSFSVRSNAEKYAKRMGWTKYFIATSEQKAMIESGQLVSFGTVIPIENVTALVEPEKESKNKRKRHVSR